MRFHFAIVQPNSTANVPSQVAILGSLAFCSCRPVILCFGSIESNALIARLINKKKFNLLLSPRIPKALRKMLAFALGSVAGCFRLNVANIVASKISPSIFLHQGQTVISGDGFGFSNLPEWNARISANTINNINASSCLDLSPYSISPSYSSWVKDHQIGHPALSIRDPLVDSKIQNIIQGFSLSFAHSFFGGNDIFAYSDCNICLIALSAFSENDRITLINEIDLVYERVLEVAKPNSVILLKPHPFNSPRKTKLMLSKLQKTYPAVEVVRDVAPVEFLIHIAFGHFKDFMFLSFQQSAVSSILVDRVKGLSSLRFGFGSDLLHRYWNSWDLEPRLNYERWVNALILSSAAADA